LFPADFARLLHLSYASYEILDHMLKTDATGRLGELISNCEEAWYTWVAFGDDLSHHLLLASLDSEASIVIRRNLAKELSTIRTFLYYRQDSFQIEDLEDLQRAFAALVRLIDPVAPSLGGKYSLKVKR
jgi:hypothetical protein